MTGKCYQGFANRTNDGKSARRLYDKLGDYYRKPEDFAFLINCCFGMSGEVGEFNDMIKKWVFHESDLDVEHLKKELGDILWYIAGVCNALNWNLTEIMEMNINKLKERYPENFSVFLSNNRKAGDL